MDLTQWVNLPERLARETGSTVISYDRAGFGKSDLPEVPHDMRLEVHWLWDALAQLGLDKDLLLVGHSFGGWMTRLEASEHPDAVRGIVFIDPFTVEFVDQLGIEYLDNHPMTGKIPFDTSDPAKLTPLQKALVRMVGGGLGPKMEIMRTTIIPEGIPVVIITSGRPILPKEEDQQAWRRAHEQMAASIPGAVLVIAETSGHMIPWSQPDLIIESVKNVLSGIHGKNPGTGSRGSGYQGED
jgi:pimeloyl-ACP methyl ester carboxylesterase